MTPEPLFADDILENGFLGQFIQQLLNADYKEKQGQPIYLHSRDFTVFREDDLICLGLGTGNGYSSFFAEFWFNEDGSLEDHALWE